MKELTMRREHEDEEKAQSMQTEHEDKGKTKV